MWKQALECSRYFLPVVPNKAQIFTNATAYQNEKEIKPFECMPGPKPLPIIGTSWVLLKYPDPLDFQTYLHKNFGDICALRNFMGVGDSVALFNVKDIETMFRNEGTWPFRRGFYSLAYYRKVLRPEIFGDLEGLLASNEKAWADFRTKVNPILIQPGIAHQYVSAINEVANDFIDRSTELMTENQDSEMPDGYMHELNKWALESIALITLDKRLGCFDKNPPEDLHKLAMSMLEVIKLFVTVDYSLTGLFCVRFNLPVWRRYVKSLDFFTKKTVELIEEAIQKVENDPNYAMKTESEKSAFEKLRSKGKMLSVVMTQDLLAAGIDSTAKIAGAALYYLATNKDIQVKLRQEIRKVLSESTDIISSNNLEQMPYLRGVIKETMRFAPVASANLRNTTKDVVLGGYHVPKGVDVFTPHLYLAKSEGHYKNPMKFMPKRWLRDHPESELKSVNPFVSLPFGYGPRTCIGKRLALLELQVLITKMVQKFDISWKHGPMTFKQDLLYGLNEPLKLQLAPI